VFGNVCQDKLLDLLKIYVNEVGMGRKKISDLSKSVADNGNGKGNYLERRDPALAVQALDMLANGDSFHTVSKATGLTWETVSRLKARHKMVLDERRAMLAEDALEIAEGLRLLQKEKMRMLAEDPEQLARTNIRDLTLPWGISLDKYMTVLGENKVTVEHKSAAPSLEDAMKAIEEARAKLKASSMEVITKDVTNG
jgi:hypothetical protein